MVPGWTLSGGCDPQVYLFDHLPALVFRTNEKIRQCATVAHWLAGSSRCMVRPLLRSSFCLPLAKAASSGGALSPLSVARRPLAAAGRGLPALPTVESKQYLPPPIE